MAEREKVDVHVRFHAKTGPLDRALAKMKALQQLERRFSSDQMLSQFAKGNVKWKKSFDFVDKAIKGTGALLGKFLMTAIKGVVLEMAALSAAMLATHALFAAGRFLVKAYHGAMQLLAGGAAAATIAIGTVAAAIREQQAAMYAYRGKGLAQFGAGINQVQVAMRSLHADAGLAGLGVEALNKAFATMSKTMSSSQIASSQKTLKALMDFGAAGQDPGKSVEQVAAVVAALNDQKKSIGQVMTAARALGPEMQKALKDAKIKTKEDFKALLFSGELAEKGGVKGQFETINNTLIGQLKTYMTLVRTEFADFGMQFLEPMKVAFEKIFEIIKRDLARISASIQGSFGSGGFIDGMVNAIDKFSNWMVKTLREYLPRAVGMFRRIGDWLFSFRRGWNLMVEKLRPMIDGAKVIEKAFVKIWEAIKRGAGNMTLFRELLVANEDTVIEFGGRMAGLIDSTSKLFMGLKKAFFSILPVINDVISGVKMIFDFLTKILTSGAGSGLMKSLAPLLAFGIIGKKMAGVAGRLSPTGATVASTMNVTAQNVNINGAGAGLSSGAAGRGPSGTTGIPPALASGAYAARGGGAMGPGGVPLSPLFTTNAANNPLINPNFRGSYGAATPQSASLMGDERMGMSFMRTKQDTGLFSHGFYNPGYYTQTSQGLMAPITMEGGFRLRDAMRAGADLKSEFGVGAAHTAGLDERHYGRTQQYAYAAPGTSTPLAATTTGVYGGTVSAVDYSRLSASQLMQLATARGVAATPEALMQQDADRRNAANVAAGTMKYNPHLFSSTFRESELPRWLAAGGGVPGRLVDPGLTEEEARGRQQMTQQSLREDRRANRRQAFRRGVGRAQGLMGYLNRGRFDFSASGGMVDVLDSSGNKIPMLDSAGKPMLDENGQPMFQQRQQQGARVNASALREEARQNNLMRAKQEGSGKAMTRLRNFRDIARINRTQTSYGAAMGKFAGSAGGRMGTSMGLAMASQYAPEEMRGAMALGGTLSMIDPRLGMAVAGVGGALKAKSVGAGALAGAMGGAQIGGMFGPWGAAIGAGIGLLAGGIMGAINKHKDNMKKATKAAQAMLNSMFTDIAATASERFQKNNELIEGGARLMNQRGAFQDIASTFVKKRAAMSADLLSGIDTSKSKEEQGKQAIDWIKKNASKYGMDKNADLIKDMELSPGKALEKFTESGSEFDKTMLEIESVNNKRISELQKATGKSAPELEKLAKELGVNLYDATTKYSDIVKQLGAAMTKTAGQMKDATIDILLGAGNIFKKRREAREAQVAIDASSATLSSQLLSGNLTADESKAAVDSYFENFSAQNLALYGGDPKKAFFASIDAFGQGAGKGIFGKGEQFEGQEEFIMPAAQELIAEQKKGIVSLYADQVSNMLTGAGLSGDKGAISAAIGKMDPQKLKTFMNLMDRGQVSMYDNAGKVRSISDIMASFKGAGLEGFGNINQVPEDTLDVFVTSATEFDKASTSFKEAVTLYKDSMNDFFKGGLNDAPTWWKKGLHFDGTNLVPVEDTMTPRAGAVGDTTGSRLQQTMARHAAMNSQLTGKRIVTSSWRDWGLGSINSDHVTGRAYDLVGQNLGSYQRLVQASGGFAEFHGTLGKRHLHVVPGMGSPIAGDMTSPRGVPAMAAQSTTGSAAGTTHNYITVNTNDPEAAAREVIRQLDIRERASRERF